MKHPCQMPLAPCSELFANTGSEPSLCALQEPSLNKKALKTQNENELVLGGHRQLVAMWHRCRAPWQLQRLLGLCPGIWLEFWDLCQPQGVPSQLQRVHPSSAAVVAGRARSPRSSGSGCTGAARAMRSITSAWGTANSSWSTRGRASPTPPSTRTRSEGRGAMGRGCRPVCMPRGQGWG